MLQELDRELADSGLKFRKVSGYDPVVWAHLEPVLQEAGWEIVTCSIMLHQTPSVRKSNPRVHVRSVDVSSSDLADLYCTDGELDRSFELERTQFRRVGGEYLVGYLDSQPACCTGWYVVNGVARFRHVFTAPWARNRGCATSLILHVQNHAEVRAQDGLVIMVNPEDGPETLYRELGFQHVAAFWEAQVFLPKPPDRRLPTVHEG